MKTLTYKEIYDIAKVCERKRRGSDAGCYTCRYYDARPETGFRCLIKAHNQSMSICDSWAINNETLREYGLPEFED